tara:strand:- start:2754 stop:4523 length:1770 start_codon:yes stop_codon:yes gene_type:complete
MVDIFFPEQKDDKPLRDGYHDFAKAGTLDVLGATLDETLYYNPASALGRLLEQKLGSGRKGTTLSAEEYQESEFFRPGIEVGDEGITTGLASLLADRHDERRDFQTTLSRSRGGIGLGAAQFGVAIAGSFLDPLNVASVFIPSVAASRFASLSARYGTSRSKIATGVVDGAIGAAVIEPVVIGAAIAEQDRDYGLMDSFMNVAVGAALGGSINAVTGGISSFGRYRRQRQLSRLNAVEADTAQRISITQVMNDEEVNLAPIEESVQTRTQAEDAAISEKKIVYKTDGTPVEVEVLDVDNDGNITVRTAEGEEKNLDASDLRSKSPFDEDYELKDEMGVGGDINISEMSDEFLETNLSLQKETLETIRQLEADGIESNRLGTPETVEANITALEVEQRRRAGETVERPAEPDVTGADNKEIAKLRKEAAKIEKQILGRAESEGLDKPRVKAAEATRLGQITARINELESAAPKADDMVDVQEGVMSSQQAEDQANAAAMQGDGLGRLGEFREEVQEIKKESIELDEPDPVEIEAENQVLLEDLASDDVQAILPTDIKKSLSDVEQLETKADKYEEVSRAGANCLIGSPKV